MVLQKFSSISFSFGQDCIFLIGGPTKATKPVPLFLHSGDISLMTGPARLSFHAVPRILHADPSYIDACFCSDQERKTGGSLAVNGHSGHVDCFSVVDDLNRNVTVTEKNSDISVIKQSTCNSFTKTDQKSVENSGTTVINCDFSSDHEVEDEDPYSSSANQNYTDKAGYMSCDSTSDNSSDQCISLSSEGGRCELSDLKSLMDKVVKETDWSPFERYLNQSRINVNVRKVMIEGESLPVCPAVIPKCQCQGGKE